MGRGGTLTLSSPKYLFLIRRGCCTGPPLEGQAATAGGALKPCDGNAKRHRAGHRKPRPKRASRRYGPLKALVDYCLSARDNARQESIRVISTARLSVSPRLHLPPIDVVVFNDPQGDLILWLASRLDAFSAYPYQTRLPGGAPGGTTGRPEVCPSRSSRTSDRATQISDAHNR